MRYFRPVNFWTTTTSSKIGLSRAPPTTANDGCLKLRSCSRLRRHFETRQKIYIHLCRRTRTRIEHDLLVFRRTCRHVGTALAVATPTAFLRERWEGNGAYATLLLPLLLQSYDTSYQVHLINKKKTVTRNETVLNVVGTSEEHPRQDNSGLESSKIGMFRAYTTPAKAKH